MELVLGGGMWSAEQAERAGLISRVVPQDELLPEAEKLAKKIAGFSMPVVAMAKVHLSPKNVQLLFQKAATVFMSTAQLLFWLTRPRTL